MAISKKSGVTSPDGDVQCSVEHYRDDTLTRVTVNASFKGRTGSFTFVASDDNVDLQVAADNATVSGKNITLSGTENVNISGNNTVIHGSDKLLVSAGGDMIMQVLSGALEIISSKKLNLGSMDKIEIRSLAKLVLQAVEKLEIIATQLQVKAASIQFGTGSRRVAMVGDAVVCGGNAGTITGPGSLIISSD